MQNRRRQTVAALVTSLLALLLVFSAVTPALALGDVPLKTVRVGFYRAEGFHLTDEDGNRSGYGYEVLQAMKLYADWTYEYVGYDKGWADIQQMMLDGEVDMVVSAVKTPAREEIYDFSSLPLAQSGACLMVKAGESQYVAGDYEGYDGMRIGFIENSAQIASTEAFAAEKGFAYTPVYFKTSDELEEAVLSGSRVDAIVTSNMRIISGTRRLELFAMQDVHAMVRKGDSELLREIDYALEQISLYSPGLYDSLYSKYYSVDTGDSVFFSPSEIKFLQEFRENDDTLRVAMQPDASPYAFFEGGKPSGILYDIASEILRRTGLRYEIIPTDSDAEYRELIDGEGVDVRLAARFDYNYAESTGYTLTTPYYSTDISRLTLKSFEGAVDSIAVVSESQIETHYLPTVVRGGGSDEILRFGSVAECVDAVLRGQCDATYLYTRTAQEAVFADVTNRLTSVIMPKFTVNFSIGVRETSDARLASIIEKAAASLSSDDTNAFVFKYTDYATLPVSLRGTLYNNPIFALLFVALLLVVVFLVIMTTFVSRKRSLERGHALQLQEALALAEQANSAKSIFMSRMSHEIRTPLNAIIGYNYISANALAEAGSETERIQAARRAIDCLAKSDLASKHLLTVINDVLDMSAIESGKIKLNHEPFDFKNVISSLTGMFAPQAQKREIDFEVVFDEPVEEWFVGDQMRINQIFTNLLSNAVKFTPSGGSIHFSINQTETLKNSTRIRFEVTDTGIGMSEEFMANLWTPFEQADASISRRFGGTGLGLSIAKNLVDLMGGDISAHSKPGSGTTFIVELTLERIGQPARSAAYDFSDTNVLVADDDKSTCDYTKLLFKLAGAECTAVTSGREAVDAVARGLETDRPYTLCIIDWRMPEMDGVTTVRKIRELAGPDIPIIIISAYDFSEVEAEARDAGVNSFVTKPLFRSTVLDLLADISGRRSSFVKSDAETPDFGGARVILAEDNKMNMEIAKMIVSSWNIRVDEAYNGTEAVDLFRRAPAGTYGAILMDVHMPEMNGYIATQTIRACDHPDAKTVPIIAMTADVFAEDVAEAMSAGMNAHIGKPIENALLLETLRKYLRT